jgi:hypothetical protein
MAAAIPTMTASPDCADRHLASVFQAACMKAAARTAAMTSVLK